MNREYLDRIKKENGWIFDEEFKANLICSDDFDSLLSCLLLISEYPDRFEIGYFYDFREGLYKKEGIDESLPMIGVDLSHPAIRCISNHVTRIDDEDHYNTNDINLNNIDGITSRNYFHKYNLNSLLLCFSLLKRKVKNNRQAATLLLPDSAFLGHYSNFENDNNANKKWLVDVLELSQVYEIQKELTKDKFEAGQRALNIKSKLWVTENGIEPMQNVDIKGICDILDIKFDPSEELLGFFSLIERHNTYTGATWQKYSKEDYFSFVVSRKNIVKYSKKV